MWFPAGMANILGEDKRQQIIALGRLDWTLRRIETATGVRRETASAYLRAAGISTRPPGRWGHPPANPAIEGSTDSASWPPPTSRAPQASACGPYRELIGVLALVKQCDPAVVEAACATALALGVADYRFVRRYLERQPAVPLTLRQVDPLIRDLTHYRDVITRLTTGATP